MNRKRLVAVLVALLVTAGGCGDETGGREQQLPARSKDNAKQAVEAYLPQVMEAVGSPRPADNFSLTYPPCEGKAGERSSDGRYYAAGSGQIALPTGAEQVATLEKLRDHFQAKGWEVKKLAVHSNGNTGDLYLRNPADGFQLAIGSTDSAEWFIVSIYSPCYTPG